MPDVQSYIDKNRQRFIEELFQFLRIPSISTDEEYKEDVHKAADFIVEKLKELGFSRVQSHPTKGHPIVYGEYLDADNDKPTILIYGHYDVQPPDPVELWDSPPFDPVINNDKVFARGSADDKGQLFIHIKSVESILKTRGELPVNVKFILEGEEEIGSTHLVPFIAEHKDLLACDMVLISDTAMFAKDTPSITYGLRGLTYMEVLLTGPNRDLHSGVYGGAVDNPANVLCEIIAKLKDENGRILIPGFYDKVKPLTDAEKEEYRRLPFDESVYMQDLGISEVKGEIGYSTLERASARPTLDVNGLWSGYQGRGAKTVLPAKAGAKVSMRLVPDQDPKEIARLFSDYVRKLAPNTVHLEIIEHHGGHPSVVDINFYGMQAASDAFEYVYGKKPLFTREGGSIPIVADFQKILGVDSILMGFSLNSDAIHSPNEHFSLTDFVRGIKTSARFMEVLEKYVPEKA